MSKQIGLDELSQYTGVCEIMPSFHVTVSIDDNGLGITTGSGANFSYAILDLLGND